MPPERFLILSYQRRLALIALAAGLAVAGCQKNPLVVKRSGCPAVAVPTYAGDVTLFRPGTPQDAGNLELVATITNVRETCNDGADTLVSDVTYDVLARRSTAAGARTETLPVFATVVQGGNLIVSKQIGAVSVSFADGQLRATGRGGAQARVARSATRLPDEIQAKLDKKRKAGDIDAATDPMSDPQVRAAVRAASFELLIGFQLGEAGLAYNITK